MQLTVASLNAFYLAALCVWREAQNQPHDARLGVYWSILNRTNKAAWWNGNTAGDAAAVVLFPYQYSSFNANDPNAVKLPKSTDKIFEDITLMVLNPGPDPTAGATHYYSNDIAAPKWVSEMTFTTKIGAFLFYK